jgi:hypothetical protein
VCFRAPCRLCQDPFAVAARLPPPGTPGPSGSPGRLARRAGLRWPPGRCTRLSLSARPPASATITAARIRDLTPGSVTVTATIRQVIASASGTSQAAASLAVTVFPAGSSRTVSSRAGRSAGGFRTFCHNGHVAPDFNASVPSVARVYDYWLGGKDNFAADRELAGKLLGIYPPAAEMARDNRQFLARAVRWVASRGVTQFLDLGAGLPTSPSTPPAPARPPRSRPLPEADQAPAHPRRPHQRIRASRIEVQVSIGGRVLEPHRRSG